MDANDPAREDSFVEQQVSYRIVNAFYEVYNGLGYGFLESIYAAGMIGALEDRGLRVQREVCFPVSLNGRLLGNQRVDIVVEGRIILELKSTELLSRAALRQVRNYLAASRFRLGILLHFGPTPQFHRVLRPKP